HPPPSVSGAVVLSGSALWPVGPCQARVLSLDSVYEYERAISENAHGTLLMHNTRSASGESHGVHHQLLSEPPMHALWPTRLRRSSGLSWGRPRHSSAAMYPV